MEVEKVMSMQGGDGEGSYLQNSGIQSRGFHTYGKPYLARAIELYKEYNGIETNRRFGKKNGIDGSRSSSSSSSRLIRIADYGCSYGWNTLDCTRFVLDSMRGSNPVCDKKDQLESPSSSSSSSSSSSEEEEDSVVMGRSSASITDRFEHVDDEERLQFQYLFVDLPSNDFNNLFRMLHDLDFATTFDGDLRLFLAGVPGSFYDRVLPPQSVDITVAIYAMHWLSRVPPELSDKANPAWNRGHVWIPSNSTRAAVAEAYAKQFQKDLGRFLRCRAEEMRQNGVMFLHSLCRTSERAPGPCRELWNGIFDLTWNELVNEGTIEASERDAFNMSFYEFSETEFREALRGVSELELVELCVFGDCDHLAPQQRENVISDPSSFGKFCASFLQSISQPLVEAHIGPVRTSVFFEQMKCIASESHRSLANAFSFDLLVAIVRKK